MSNICMEVFKLRKPTDEEIMKWFDGDYKMRFCVKVLNENEMKHFYKDSVYMENFILLPPEFTNRLMNSDKVKYYACYEDTIIESDECATDLRKLEKATKTFYDNDHVYVLPKEHYKTLDGDEYYVVGELNGVPVRDDEVVYFRWLYSD